MKNTKQPIIEIHHDFVLNKFLIQIEERFDTREEAEAHVKRLQEGCEINHTQSFWD